MMGGIKSFVNCVTSAVTLLLFLKVSVQNYEEHVMRLSAWRCLHLVNVQGAELN